MKLWKVAQQRLEDRIGAQNAERLRTALDEIARIDVGEAQVAPASAG
jgi:hypothetical protein